MHDQRIHIDAALVVETAIVLADANNLVAHVCHQLRSVRADIAEALYDDSCAFRLHAELAHRFVTHDHQAAPRRFPASARSTDVERLTRDHGSYRLTHVHGVGIHDPRHGLLVGIHVRSGNVFFRTDELDELRGVATSNFFEFGL